MQFMTVNICNIKFEAVHALLGAVKRPEREKTECDEQFKQRTLAGLTSFLELLSLLSV